MINEKLDMLGNRFIFGENVRPEDFKDLDIQDVVFLIFTTQALAEKKTVPNFDGKERLTLFTAILVDKLKKAKELYIAYDKNTKYPYVDFNGRAWIFSKREYAEKAVAHFEGQSINLDIKDLKDNEVLNEFAKLHYVGIERAILDNGKYNTEIVRNHIIPLPDYSNIPEHKIPIMNPKLQFAIISFFQTAYSKQQYEGKGRVLQAIERSMLGEMVNAKYLVPIKFAEGSENSNEANPKAGYAIIRDKNDLRWLPAFTDWAEFGKAFNRQEWKGKICTFQEILKMTENMAGSVINCNGLSLKVDENNKKKIEEFMKK